jgi:hypothetical protein
MTQEYNTVNALERVAYLATQKEIPDTYLMNKKRIVTVKNYYIPDRQKRVQHSTIIEPFS